MAPERWRRIEQLYHLALEQETNHRATFVEQACGGDESLQRDLELLLAQSDDTDGFLEAPALEVAARDLASTNEPRRPTLNSGFELGHYRIVEKIGEGGMGEVYRALDQHLEREVAIKVLSPGTVADETARRRFRKEARALSKLNHPAIATIHDFDTQQGLDFLVMEYIPGITLNQKLAKQPLAGDEVVRLGVQLAEGVQAAHEQGVIHRDLKPSNLRLNSSGRLKILDFGVAKLAGPSGGAAATQTLTEKEGLSGTLPYMAPEQLLEAKADARTDIYAVGAVLYEMSTGRRVFHELPSGLMIAAILRQAPQRPTHLNSQLSQQLEAIILKCLDKDPMRRYQSARELQTDLERLSTSGAAALAPSARAPWQRRVWRASWARPWRLVALVLFFAAGVVAVFLLAGTRPALSFAPRDWILLTDIDNQTGYPLFDRSLLTALTISLEQSAHTNVFPHARLAETLKRMGKPPAEKIDEELGREICIRENIRGLLSTHIGRLGQEYLLSAQIIDPRTGSAVRSYLKRANREERVLNALEEIATSLRRALGESLNSIERSDRPLPRVTTASLQALKYYADGREAWQKRKKDEAEQLFQSALRLDPNFAMAHAALGDAYASFQFNDPAGGKRELEKALQLSERTTERERLAIQIDYAHDLGHVEEATSLYRIYLDRYPDAVSMREKFAYLLMQSSQYQEAIEQYQQVLRITPNDAPAWVDLAASESGVGRVAEALRHYEAAFRLEPTWITSGNLNHEYGFALVTSGNEGEARRVFEMALAKPDLKARGLRSLAWLALYHGRYREAGEKLQEALFLDQARKQTLSEMREHFLLSLVAEGRGDGARAVRELDAGSKLLPEIGEKVWAGSLFGSAYARRGALAKAARLAALVKPLVDPGSPQQNAYRHRLEAEIALAQGQNNGAVELFKLADKEERTPMGLYGLARAYEAAGDANQATAWFGNLIALPQTPLGWEPQQDWLAAHCQLAATYLARGDKAKAAPLLERLLALWKDGDPDVPIVRRARAVYEKLKLQ